MILFARDYAFYPTCMIDLKTTNKSFLVQAAKYKAQGIKNYAFILTLLNPKLQGVDPFSPDLTLEQKNAIKVECRYNPWYLLREVARVKGQGGVESVPFLATRGNIALFWSYLNHIDIVNIQPRQTGKSVGADFVAIWVLIFGGYNSAINLITLTEKLRIQNIERIKACIKYLPKYLVEVRPDDADNSMVITHKARGNKMNTFVNQKAEDAARNTGRGFTSGTNMMDEWGYFLHVSATMAGALGSSLAAREVAEQHGAPYGNIFTTTAGKRDSRDGKKVYEMVSGGMPFSEKLFDCENQAQALKMVKDHTTGPKIMINATFSHRQLGKTDEWALQTIGELGLSPDEADRDIFNVWTNGSADSPLSIEQNRTIAESAMDPLWQEVSQEGYIFNWYIPEDKVTMYMSNFKTVMGVDTSDLVKRDATTFVLRDVRTLEVIGTAAINEGSILNLAKWFANFLVKYRLITAIIESKSSAYTFIDSCLITLPMAGINPFERLYNTIVQQRDTREQEFREVMDPRNIGNQPLYERYKRHIGFNTSAESRMTLYRDILQASAKGAGDKVRDIRLCGEITGLVMRNGRIDHKASGNDDTVISWLLGHWLLAEGRNLECYGLNPSENLSMMISKEAYSDPQEVANIRRRQWVRQEIERLLAVLRDSTDGKEIARTEHALKLLSETTYRDGGEVFSMDALKRQSDDIRRNKAYKHALQNRGGADTSAFDKPWYLAS